MKWQVIFLTVLSFLNSYAECKWKSHDKRGANWRETANEVTHRPRGIPDPPDHTKLIPMARYVLHNAGNLQIPKFCFSKNWLNYTIGSE